MNGSVESAAPSLPDKEANLLSSADAWIGSDDRYRLVVGVIVALGWLAHSPRWTTHFHQDDVWFFADMCEALQQDAFGNWLFLASSGHVSTIPKLGYYADWRWLGRNVLWWHFAAMVIWSVALIVLCDLFRRLFRSRFLAVALLATFAWSRAYRATIMDTHAANHLWACSLASVALWSAYRAHSESLMWLLPTLTAGLAAYLCSAMGGIVFFILALMGILPFEGTRRRRIALVVMALAGIGGVIAFQRAVGLQGRIDPWYGIRQLPGGALHMMDTALWPDRDVSRALSLVLLIVITLQRRHISVETFILGAAAMVFPILAATSVRANFDRVGGGSRFAFIPTIGAMLWLGAGLRALLDRPVRIRLHPWMTGALAGICVFVPLRTAWQERPRRTAGTAELFQLEDQLGFAVRDYARARHTASIVVPARNIQLPCTPHFERLDRIARYAVPVSARIEVTSGADPDLIDYLRHHAPIVYSALR